MPFLCHAVLLFYNHLFLSPLYHIKYHDANVSPWLPGLLSEKEYQNPLLVFKKTFEEYSIKEFDYFISGMVYFSLGAYGNIPENTIVSPYIYLTKMLDAAHLILERRGMDR